MASPYDGAPVSKWEAITKQLISEHPLDPKEIVEVTLQVWAEILASKVGSRSVVIGSDLRPKPQIMAFLLHELIPLELAFRYPDIWRGDKAASEKDLVHIPDDRFSVEIKTSSHASQIFGNRSYAQQGTSAKKSKAGYYLAVNFDPFRPGNGQPEIRVIRLGWLDHADWAGQKAATGQQARLSPDVERYKLLRLFPNK